MGIFKISLCLDFEPSLKLSPPFLLIIITTTFSCIAQSTPIIRNDQDGIDDVLGGTTQPPEAPTPTPKPFKPGVAIFVGFLTIIVCFTFLVLLYAKHCRGGIRHLNNNNLGDNNITPNAYERQNSGVERTVVEALPTFKFASLRGPKDGLECAVCLNKFEPTEVLRLLPKCNHAFHVECLDTWLDIHSTCPLCRYRVERDDIIVVDRGGSSNNSTTSSRLLSGVVQTPPPPPPLPLSKLVRKDYGSLHSRHSSGGASGSSLSSLEVIVEQPKHVTKMKSTNSLLSSSSRSKRSFDDLRSFNKKHISSIKRTIPATLSSTNSLDSISESSIDGTRKDRLSLGGRNNNPGRSTFFSGVQENVVAPRTQNYHRRGITSLFGGSKKPNIMKKAMSLRISRTTSLDPCNESNSSGDVRREDELLALGEKHRLQHKIIIGELESTNDTNGPRVRWSDVQPSDMLYLQSEMILSDANNTNRVTGLKGSKSSILSQVKGCSSSSNSSEDRKVSNERSVSEMTGLSRFRSHKRRGNENNVGGVISRLKTWIPKSKQQPSSSSVDVASPSTSSNVV